MKNLTRRLSITRGAYFFVMLVTQFVIIIVTLLDPVQPYATFTLALSGTTFILIAIFGVLTWKSGRWSENFFNP